MGIADITGSRAKLIRANEHLEALDICIHEFGRTEATNMVRITYGHDEAWHIVYLSPIPSLPLVAALIAGDCLNNVRAALDHLIWQLILREGHEPEQINSFPICETVKHFREKCVTPACNFKKHPLKGIPLNGPAWALIERAQPFKSPQPERDALLLLNWLTNVDKHRTILVQHAFVKEKFSSLIRWHPHCQPVEQRFATLPMSSERPTEIARFRFAPGVVPHLDRDMNMDGELPIEPSLGDGKTQVGIGLLKHAICRVHNVLNETLTLPRVEETALQSVRMPASSRK